MSLSSVTAIAVPALNGTEPDQTSISATGKDEASLAQPEGSPQASIQSKDVISLPEMESHIEGAPASYMQDGLLSGTAELPFVDDYFMSDYNTGERRIENENLSVIPGDGFNTYSDSTENMFSYKVKLIDSPRAELYRSVLQDVADELRNAGLANLTIVPGVFQYAPDPTWEWATPDRGEIHFYTTEDYDCGVTSAAACANPLDETWGGTIVAGLVWIKPYVDLKTVDYKRHIVAHEIGHIFGLRHYNDHYLGQTQVMHWASNYPGLYQLGDRNGLRFCARKFVPLGKLESVSEQSSGIIRVKGWVYAPFTSGDAKVRITINGKPMADPIVNVSRPDIVADEGLPVNKKPGFDFSINAVSGTYAVCATTLDYTGKINVELGCETVKVPFLTDRISGVDRYTSAVEVSKAGFSTTAGVVFVANGTDFPDALSAGPAASKLGGPLLLTEPGTLPTVVREELIRLKPGKIVIVGGTNGVGAAVETQLKGISNSVVRLSGSDRYETSRKIAAYAFENSSTVYIATGASYVDALGAGAAAANAKGPFLLVNGGQSTADSAILNQLGSLKASRVIVIGGDASVVPGTFASIKSKVSNTIRVSGADRYLTSAAISQISLTSAKRAFVVTGLNFPEGIVAAPLAAKFGSPVYLSNLSCLELKVHNDMRRLGTTHLTLVGGRTSLSPNVGGPNPCPDTSGGILPKLY